MKKLLLSSLVAALLLPGLVFAANGDVTLSTDVDISANSVTMDINGSTATIESIEVRSGSAIVTMQDGSVFNVSVAALNKLIYDVAQPAGSPAQINVVCTGSASTLSASAIGETTLTIDPLSTLCAAAAAAASGSSKGDAKGGGGGGGGAVTTPAPVAPVITAPVLSTAEAIVAVRAQLIAVIQQLIALIMQQIAALQASGANY